MLMLGIAASGAAQNLPPHHESSLGVPGYPRAKAMYPENAILFSHGTATLIATTPDTIRKIKAHFKRHLKQVNVTRYLLDRYLPSHESQPTRILEMEGVAPNGSKITISCRPDGKKRTMIFVTSHG